MSTGAVRATDWIAHHARRQPDALAMVDLGTGRRFTYADLDWRAGQVAAALARGYGVTAGDRVAILSQNNTNTFEIQFGCWRLGAAYVPLNWRLAVPELEFIVGDCAPKVLFHEASMTDTATRVAETTGVPARVSWDGPAMGAADYEQLLANADTSFLERHDNRHSTLACIMYTSGTTGHPKGAMITHGGMLWNLINAARPYGLRSGMVSLSVLPLFHIGGINGYANPAFYFGGASYIMKSFDPVATLTALADPQIGVSHFVAVPTVWLFMSQQPAFAAASFPSLTTAAIGGSPTSATLLETWAAKGVNLQHGYGMTESAGFISVQDREDTKRKLGSVGLPLMHIEHRIVDENGNDVEPGAVGELWVRGPNISPGYWNRPDANASDFTDDFLHTGDAMREDAEGHLHILDRWKDMYISGGENVYPAEVENVIYQLDGVGEVAVIGQPDERWGEVGHAVVVLKPGAMVTIEDVLAHCNANLARYKVPVRVSFVAELPHNATGKLLKRELRAQFSN